jgi:hypothetical protein
MASNRAQQLADLLKVAVVSGGQPLNGACVAGPIDGFPVAVSWGKRQNQSSVLFLVRFRKNTLRLSPDAFCERVAGSTEVLGAMERKKLSGAESKALSVGPDSLLFFWDYSLRAPRPEAVAAVARLLVGLVKGQAEHVQGQCEVCGRSGVGELYSVSQVLISVCAVCRERMGEEDRRAMEAYEALPANPLLGTAAGAGVAVAAALAWGGVAYGLQKIFLYAAFVIGFGVAFAVHKGMGKINLYGRIVAVLLTMASVLAGDFFFMCLSVSAELHEPLSFDLAARALPHFFAFEFSDSSGYVSVLFGVLGAIGTLVMSRRPVQGRVFVPIARTA